MIAKKINLIFWSAFLLFFVVVTVLHPRIAYGLMILICITEVILIKKGKIKRSFWINTLSGIIVLGIVWFWAGFLNLFCPYHAVYEYKSDMERLNRRNFDYSHFPDEIPASATRIRWILLPSFLQGTGYEALFFYADADYLEEIYQEYENEAEIYLCSSEFIGNSQYFDWVNEEDKSVLFPMKENIPAGTEENVTVMVLEDNEDWNHHQIRGIYLNQTDGYICFFTQ